MVTAVSLGLLLLLFYSAAAQLKPLLLRGIIALIRFSVRQILFYTQHLTASPYAILHCA